MLTLGQLYDTIYSGGGNMNTINERLQYLRSNHLGLNQKQMANILKTTNTTLSKMENGTRPITEKTIQLICHEFHVSESWLTAGIGEMFDEKPVNNIDLLCDEFSLSDIERMIFEKFLKFDKKKRQLMLSLAIEMLTPEQRELTIDEEMENELSKYNVRKINNETKKDDAI